MFKCNFCNKEYSNDYTLKTHKKKAKFCLKIQEKLLIKNIEVPSVLIKNNHICSYCNKEFNIKQNFEGHLQTCKYRKKQADSNLQEELNIIKKELFKTNIDNNHLIQEVIRLREDYKTLVEKNISSKKSITNNNYNNTYNLKFQEAFEKLPEFSSENILKALIKNISSSSIKSEDFFINDVVKTIKDYTIVTDPSRGKAYIKNEEGLKEKTYTEKIVRNTLGIYKEEGHRLCENNRSKIPDNEIYTDHNIKMSGNMGSIQCYLNTSSSDRINDLTIKGGNKLSKEGILILKTEEQKELLITFNIDE